MEMLEFLAEFEDEDTGWMDPLELMEVKEQDEIDDNMDNDTTQEEGYEQ